MGKDRLGDLQANSEHLKSNDAAKKETDTPDESTPLTGPDQSKFLEDFLKRFETQVTSKITEIKKNVQDIHNLQLKLNISVQKQQIDDAERELSILCERNKELGRMVQIALQSEKSKLEEKRSAQLSPLKKFNNKAKYDKKQETRQYDLKVQQSMIESESRRYLEVWSQYNEERLKYQKQSKEILKNKCKIANSHLTDEQIEEMIDDGNTQVFNECILARTELTRQQLSDLEERHKGLQQLEKSISELHEMFAEIGRLVENQGEIVDNILMNVQRAAGDVEKGRDELRSAEQNQRSARKKKLICGSILIVVLLIVLLVILSEFGAFSSGSNTSYPTTPSKAIIASTTTVFSTTTEDSDDVLPSIT